MRTKVTRFIPSLKNTLPLSIHLQIRVNCFSSFPLLYEDVSPINLSGASIRTASSGNCFSPIDSMPKRKQLNNSIDSDFTREIIQGLHRKADPKSRDWFSNYVKGSTWIGCKLPVVREVVKNAIKKQSRPIPFNDLVNDSVTLLRQRECDVKLSGMLLLSEHCSIEELTELYVLQRLIDDVLLPGHYIADWSTADWFATKVLRRIVFSGDHDLALKVLEFSHNDCSLWHRRCGIVSFLQYQKHRDTLPPDIGSRLVEAVEKCLLASPEERFTQTGCAWVLRYVLLQEQERKDAVSMIERNAVLWNTEAKKSLVEKLDKKDPLRSRILGLGK